MPRTQESPFDLPGFTRPLHFSQGDYNCPVALDCAGSDTRDFPGHVATLREIVMLAIMNTITDKKEWDRKVFDEEIVKKWRQEISESDQDATERMMDWVIEELQQKTEVLKEENLIPVFDVGVVKSDTAIPVDLKRLLKEAAAPFENVPEEEKDYHPNSDQKVVDLVHQSLFPVVYGRTHILRDRVIGLDDCLGAMTEGERLPVPSLAEKRSAHSMLANDLSATGHKPYSQKFQWLPCNVEFTDDENECRIISYINNAHPVKHRALYDVVEKIIARAIPLWNRSLTLPTSDHGERIPYDMVEYQDPDEEEPGQEPGEDDDDYWERVDDWSAARLIALPEPSEEFTPPNVSPWSDRMDLRSRFKETGLQVIVKLANIELTPEKPDYDGGSWHIEGQLNERICATAVYYYDSSNITESKLHFRQRIDVAAFDEISYEQERHEFLQHVYGFEGRGTSLDDGITQDLGGVVCREDRLLTFPNLVQHRVTPFSLVDKSKPGHRKILALFLIDPHRRIISSANVPPQQHHWAEGKMDAIDQVLSLKLPNELVELVRENEPRALMTMREAKAYRVELMKERGSQNEKVNAAFNDGEIMLCEH